MIQHNIINDLVFNAIKENASENNPISQTAIQNKLCENPENKCDRKTVGRALERLRENLKLLDKRHYILTESHIICCLVTWLIDSAIYGSAKMLNK